MQNACIVGKRLNTVCEWWRSVGKPEDSFIRWVHTNFIGSELGSMHQNELYNLLSIARLEAQFPLIIFITSMNWRTIARNPQKFHAFVTADPARQLFWTSADYKFRVKAAPNTGLISGAALTRPGNTDKIELMNLEPEYQTMRDLYIQERKDTVSKQLAFGEEIEMLEDDIGSDD